MNNFFSSFFHCFVIGKRFVVLFFAICFDFVRKFFTISSNRKSKPVHLEKFMQNKALYGCNLPALYHSLKGDASDTLILAELINKQKEYRVKEDLYQSLPPFQEKCQIIAIPLAVKVLGFYRHFVTIIIDKREGIIEFYDSIGFTISDYKNTILWAPNCKTKDALMLSELMSYAKSFYKIETIRENKVIHQKDFVRCALFVYDRIYKRAVKGFSFQKAGRHPLPSY